MYDLLNEDLAMVMIYPDWWKDMSVLGLQEEVKYLLLNQQIAWKETGTQFCIEISSWDLKRNSKIPVKY